MGLNSTGKSNVLAAFDKPSIHVRCCIAMAMFNRGFGVVGRATIART
ncbi:MAG: hypothetical protein ACKO15_09010 [Burkholderiales bacterium]